MGAYTDVLYEDMADPAINGLTTHSNDPTAHNLPAQFAAIDAEIDRIDDELATKVSSVDLSGKADVTGDTFTGTVIFEGGDQAVIVNGPEQTDRSLRGKTGGANRWELSLASNDDEMGSNSGSNLVVARYDDAGNFLGIPFAIDRQTGKTYIDQLQVGGGSILVGEGLDVRLQDTEPTTNLKLGTVWLRPSAGPGGPPIGNLPTNGMIANISASSITGLSHGQVINSVPDLSSANNPATGIGSPVYLTNQTPSGEPAMRGGNPGHLTLPAATTTGMTAGHAFVYVAEVESGEKSGPWQIGGARTQHFDGLIEEGLFRSYSTSFVPAPNHKMAWRIIEVSHDGSTQRNYIDGSLNRSESGGFYGGQPLLLRSGENVGAGSGFIIADFILYNRVLTAQEAGDVRQYLINKNGNTGPIQDKQFDAVMALNPWLYLPLTSNYNDFSGNNNHAQNTSTAASIQAVPYQRAAPSPNKAFCWYPTGPVSTNHNLYVSALPNYSALDAFSMSWWATRSVVNTGNDPTSNSQTSMDMMLGDNLQVVFGVYGISINLNGTWYGAIANTASSRTIMDHYCLTVFKLPGNDCRFSFYINGNLVLNTTGGSPWPSGGGSSMLFQRGTNPAQTDDWGQHFAFFNTELSQAQVQSLTNARVA